MIENNQKTSLLIPSQLPEFIRDDSNYETFVLFLQSYYEWLEQNGNVLDGSKNIVNYIDIDNTLDQFLDYFYNDFLSFFPKNILGNKKTVAKIAKELYQSKGTPSSYKFLFKVLYDSDVEFFFTKEAVLKASAGNWYAPKSLNLSTSNPNFLDIKAYRIFGETTKALATIENSLYDGTKTVVFISNVNRTFRSGEFIQIIDENNQTVVVDGVPLRAKVVGQITQIIVDNKNNGLLYQSGDPITIFGGLNSPTALPATAVVGETTKGSLQSIVVSEEGYGYRLSPNTLINISGGTGATAHVASLDPNPRKSANVSFIPTDIIYPEVSIQINAADYGFSNIATSNVNTKLSEAFTFTSFTSYPISSVLLDTVGAGIVQAPTITATSLYETSNTQVLGNLANLGILAPIQIITGGHNYEVNDKIVFTGGTGYGVYANVKVVDANGSILVVDYVHDTDGDGTLFPLGGMGFKIDSLPTVTVSSANNLAANASLVVSGILGQGAEFTTSVDRVGSIQSIIVTNKGSDYISEPLVSLKVQDISVNGVDYLNLPQNGDIIYQGNTVDTATYISTVDLISPIYRFNDPLQTIYNLRVFDYTSKPDISLPLKIDSSQVSINITNQYNILNTSSKYDSTGVINYGDGTAKANAVFLNGLITGTGQYIDTSGQLSSFDVLQSEDYNNYTYEITLDKEIEKYREFLYNLLHPTGTKLIGRYSLKEEERYNYTLETGSLQAHTLGFYTGNPGSYAVMNTNFTNISTNTVNYVGLSGADLTKIIFANNTLKITTSNGFSIYSEVKEVLDIFDTPIPGLVRDLEYGSATIDLMANNYTFDLNRVANTYTTILKDDFFLTFPNVIIGSANAGTNTINITTITNSYNIVNNGVYSDPEYRLKDIIYAGDRILLANNGIESVANVDYSNNIIYTANNLTYAESGYITVNRTFEARDVVIYGELGTQYYPSLTDEYGNILTTEDEKLILLG